MLIVSKELDVRGGVCVRIIIGRYGGFFMKKKKVILLILIVLLMITFGMSYAYWQFTVTQESENLVGTSCLEVTYTDKNPIYLEKSVPIYDEEGKKLVPYEFTITNICDTNVTYEVNLEVLEKSTLKNYDYIKFMLNEKEPEILTNKTSVQASLEEALIAFPLKSGYLGGKESVSYTLRLWLDENTPTESTYMNKLFASKISVVSLNYLKEIDKTPPVAAFSTTKVNGGYLVDARSSTDDNSGIAKYYYSKDGENWITSTEDNYIFKDDAVMTSGIASEVIESIAKSTIYDIYVKVEDKFENVSSVVKRNVKARELQYDDTVDKNLRYVGANPNNYVTFSGQSWRIIGVMNHVLDQSGNQKTELKLQSGSKTGSYWDNANGKDNWATSTLKTSLNNYYNNLNAASKNMVDEVLWNIGALGSIPGGGIACYQAEKATGATWSGKIGTFAPSDYRYSGGWVSQMARYSDVQRQWTMFTLSGYKKAWFLNEYGSFGTSWTSYTEYSTAFPTIYLKPEVKIISGNGTSSNPYILSNS